jgi:hypothetical protein
VKERNKFLDKKLYKVKQALWEKNVKEQGM